ncbi:MAG: periplasmic binding protein [Paenibacillus sp.]|nr:periplasmic binding protein [Paenibacillus sp.]
MRHASKAASRSFVIALVTFVMAALLLAACGGNGQKDQGADNAGTSSTTNASQAPTAAKPAADRTLTDAAGHSVTIPANPKRIIAPFLEDGLTTIGVKPVAQWSANGTPQQYLQSKLTGVPPLNMMGGLKPEEALSYNPDLIILLAPTYLSAGKYEDFAKIAPTYILSTDENDWRGNLTKLGQVLGKTAETEKALKDYDAKVASAKTSIKAKVGDKTAVLYQSAAEKGFKLFGAKFYSGALLYDGVGFKQPKVLKGDYETYSLEALAELVDVDYIFVLSGPGRPTPPVDSPLWKSLPAVQKGNVFHVDSGHWFNQNVMANQLILDDIVKNVVK